MPSKSKTDSTANVDATENQAIAIENNTVANDPTKLQIHYISAQDAIKKFRYLYEYNSSIYSRKSTELTTDEYVSYQLTLTVPKLTETGTHIRITDAIQVFEFQGELYIASGNSRIKTIEQMITRGSKAQFADIPYVILPVWNDEELMRIQFATNDNTRKNDRLTKLQQIAAYIQRTVESEIGANDGRTQAAITASVKKVAQEKFSLSPTDIKNALLIVSQKVPEIVSKYLNDDLIKVDPAIELINIKNALGVEPSVVIGDLTKDQKPLSTGNIKKWRDNYTQNSTDSKAVVENHLKKGKDQKPGSGDDIIVTTPPINAIAPPKPPESAENKTPVTEQKEDNQPSYVPLGKFKLSSSDDAIAALYTMANLMENNQLHGKTDNVKRQIFQLMDQLADLQVLEEKHKAIAEQFKPNQEGTNV